jgi:hypothetical protein
MNRSGRLKKRHRAGTKMNMLNMAAPNASREALLP